MNIFALDEDPRAAARCLCDKHIPKMCVESAQMMASALLRHGARPEQMPNTKTGKPYKGGYHHHPCTVWAGVNRGNYHWLAAHASELCRAYTDRFGKVHACESPIHHMQDMIDWLPDGLITPHAQAMPDYYKRDYHVRAYREYYMGEKMHFARWDHGPAPLWLRIGAVNYVRDSCR